MQLEREAATKNKFCSSLDSLTRKSYLRSSISAALQQDLVSAIHSRVLELDFEVELWLVRDRVADVAWNFEETSHCGLDDEDEENDLRYGHL